MKTLAFGVAAAVVCSLAGSAAAQVARATATLAPASGSSVAGAATFTQEGQTIVMVVQASGLKPGPHGFHIHEKGDCSAPDASSAGGHLNPAGQPHGDPKGAAHHAGDMPMLVADSSGNATLKFDFGPMSTADIVGKSVVVHADADDFKTQPAGNSGARIACGVIKQASP